MSLAIRRTRLFMNKLIITVFILLSSSIFAESNYDRDQLLLAIDNGLSKKNDTMLVSALSRSVDYYQSSQEEKFLLRFLKKFDKILKHNDAFFLIENVIVIYKKDPEKFKKVLKEALSKEDYKRFMDHINNMEREARRGNG